MSVLHVAIVNCVVYLHDLEVEIISTTTQFYNFALIILRVLLMCKVTIARQVAIELLVTIVIGK